MSYFGDFYMNLLHAVDVQNADTHFSQQMSVKHKSVNGKAAPWHVLFLTIQEEACEDQWTSTTLWFYFYPEIGDDGLEGD